MAKHCSLWCTSRWSGVDRNYSNSWISRECVNIREPVLGFYGRPRDFAAQSWTFEENGYGRVLAPPPFPPTSYPILVGLISCASSILQFVGLAATCQAFSFSASSSPVLTHQGLSLCFRAFPLGTSQPATRKGPGNPPHCGAQPPSHNERADNAEGGPPLQVLPREREKVLCQGKVCANEPMRRSGLQQLM